MVKQNLAKQYEQLRSSLTDGISVSQAYEYGQNLEGSANLGSNVKELRKSHSRSFNHSHGISQQQFFLNQSLDESSNKAFLRSGSPNTNFVMPKNMPKLAASSKNQVRKSLSKPITKETRLHNRSFYEGSSVMAGSVEDVVRDFSDKAAVNQMSRHSRQPLNISLEKIQKQTSGSFYIPDTLLAQANFLKSSIEHIENPPRLQSQTKKTRHAQSFIDLEAIKKSINQKTVTNYTKTLEKNLKSVASLNAHAHTNAHLGGLHPSVKSLKQTYGDAIES